MTGESLELERNGLKNGDTSESTSEPFGSLKSAETPGLYTSETLHLLWNAQRTSRKRVH